MFSLNNIFQRYNKKIIARVCLAFIMFGFIGNNLFWGAKSPVYFYRDSIMNINWAVYYGKMLKNEKLAYRPDLFRLLEKKKVQRDTNIYYREEYGNIFKGPILKKEKVDLSDLLRFHHPPLWFIFLGGLFAIFGFYSWVVFLGQGIIGVMAILVTYFVGKKICSVSAGLFSAFVLSTLPSFLNICRQGFLETALLPLVLTGIILVDCILKYPLKRINYIFLGLICGVGMLTKTTFSLFVVLFFLIIAIFVDKKKIGYSVFLKNLLIAVILILVLLLPWYMYARGLLYEDIISNFHKGGSQKIIDFGSLFTLLPLIKNVQLGFIFFAVFILGITYFCIKPRFSASYLIAFLFFGYIFVILVPIAVISRYFSPFLPLITVLISCAVVDIPRFKRIIIIFLIGVSFAHGYGWFALGVFSRADQMIYFYDDIGVKYNRKYPVYSVDIKSSKLFSSYIPLPIMQQKAVYSIIKEISSPSGLKLIKITWSDKHILEARTLAAGLSLYSMFESFPLIIENPSPYQHEFFSGRIWLFVRGLNEDIESFLNINKKKSKTRYIRSIFLSPAIICDIFLEI